MTAGDPVAHRADWDAVVLAGGASRRMGGGDKTALDVGGSTMLDRVLSAVDGAARTVVVGPRRPTSRPVEWCSEDPPGAGPAAGLAAGLAHVTAPVVVVVAADQPLLDTATVRQLLTAIDRGADCADGAVAVDADDHPQWLCSSWRIGALRGARLEAGRSLRAAFDGLRWGRVRVDPVAAMDCDTPEDLRRLRGLAR
jgi:molybdopterin-guanine dinucleotide biosynthesis protein A